MAIITAKSEAEPSSSHPTTLYGRPLHVLTFRQVRQIDDALASLGPYAEVKLIKDNGRVRFIQKTESESAVS